MRKKKHWLCCLIGVFCLSLVTKSQIKMLIYLQRLVHQFIMYTIIFSTLPRVFSLSAEKVNLDGEKVGFSKDKFYFFFSFCSQNVTPFWLKIFLFFFFFCMCMFLPMMSNWFSGCFCYLLFYSWFLTLSDSPWLFYCK